MSKVSRGAIFTRLVLEESKAFLVGFLIAAVFIAVVTVLIFVAAHIGPAWTVIGFMVLLWLFLVARKTDRIYRNQDDE